MSSLGRGRRWCFCFCRRRCHGRHQRHHDGRLDCGSGPCVTLRSGRRKRQAEWETKSIVASLLRYPIRARFHARRDRRGQSKKRRKAVKGPRMASSALALRGPFLLQFLPLYGCRHPSSLRSRTPAPRLTVGDRLTGKTYRYRKSREDRPRSASPGVRASSGSLSELPCTVVRGCQARGFAVRALSR